LNILSFTTISAGSVAIYSEKRLKYSAFFDLRTTHSETLLPEIDRGLKKSDLKISDIDLVVISHGPGSFTGTRIGLASAKGICMARSIPLVWIDSLTLLAHNVYGSAIPILALIDARMQEVYAALFSPKLETIIPPVNIKPAELAKKLGEPVLIVGDGGEVYRDIFKASEHAHKFALPHQNLPKADGLISIVLHKQITASYDFDKIANLEPLYLRKSQAELVRDKKQKEQKE
jgi:tRNA threonylcarbamoyladenosine biosynthesis protein TsaB